MYQLLGCGLEGIVRPTVIYPEVHQICLISTVMHGLHEKWYERSLIECDYRIS